MPLLIHSSSPQVALLLVDAEGHDLAVLRQFPFAISRPQRVAYEPSHLSRADQRAAADLLTDRGYAHVFTDWGPSSDWQWEARTALATKPRPP